MRTLLLFSVLLASDPGARNTQVAHELLWQSDTLRVYRIGLATHERSALHEHGRAVLAVPLTSEELLEAETQGQAISWEARNGVHVAQRRRQHSLFNPGDQHLNVVEIEFPLTQDKVLVPRFTEGVKDQRFRLTHFTLGRHVLLPGEKLPNMQGCRGVVLPMSPAAIGGGKNQEAVMLNAGDAIPFAADLENAGSLTVTLLSLCEPLAEPARRKR